MLSDLLPSNIWIIIDSRASNYMAPLDTSCFKNYSIDSRGPNTIKGINGNTKVLGIGTITLISPNGGESVLHDIFHVPGLPYSPLSLGPLMMVGNTITFNDRHCIIESSIGFLIKSKVAPWHPCVGGVGHVTTSSFPHIAKVTSTRKFQNSYIWRLSESQHLRALS